MTTHVLQDLCDQVSEVYFFDVELDRAGIDPRRNQKIFDQTGETIDLPVHRLVEVARLFSCQLEVWTAQRPDEALQGCQRSPKLMGRDPDEVGFHLIELPQPFGCLL